MKDRLSTISTALLTLCVIILTGMTARREFFPPAQKKQGETVAVPNWRTYTDAGQWIGPRDATVTIVEFADFQCPACRVAATRMQALRRRYPDRVAVLYRHAPIPSHEFAAPAARASICAADQGRFEAYHDALFAHQKRIGEISWAEFADSAGVPDARAFASCIQRGGPNPVLERDQKAAERLGVTATPTLLINDQLIVGAPSEEELATLVEKALLAASSSRSR